MSLDTEGARESLEVGPTASQATETTRGWSLTRVVGGFSLVNAIVMLAGLVSGPLQARALGPAGRGELAAITVPLTIAPVLVGLGLGAYAARASARNAPLGTLIGTVAALLLLIGVVIAGVSPAVADVFAAGRETVYVFLIIGFALMPFSLFTYLLWGVNQGLERWRPMAMNRLTPPVLGTAAIAILFALDELTLGTAAAVFLSVGVLAQLPLFNVLRSATRVRFDRRVAREALVFGFPAWIATLGGYANFRLDQLLMIRLTSSAELGFYAVAATLAAFSVILTGSIQTAIVPRVARGDRELAQRATRMSVTIVGTATVLAAALTPFVLPALFGHDFEPAVPMALILLAAGIPYAGVQVLSVVLTAWGHPKAPARAEVAALAITVPGLILLIPLLGGRGAALVSLAAYSTNFLIQLVAARRSVGGGVWSYLAVTRVDVRWARERFRRHTDASETDR
jgi:O-antigen/teichoic acid export membrane protein